MNLKVLLLAINGIIPGGISMKDFAVVVKSDHKTSKNILEEMIKNEIGEYENEQIFFKENDKLRFALYAIQKGVQIDEISKYLNWRDFEGLVGEILESHGFNVTRNLILKKPKREIDVIGTKLGITIIIDCKHWKSLNASVLKNTVKKQILRVKQYLTETNSTIAVPAIVTLHQEQIRFIENVPIIPIIQLSTFLDEFYGNIDKVSTL